MIHIFSFCIPLMQKKPFWHILINPKSKKTWFVIFKLMVLIKLTKNRFLLALLAVLWGFPYYSHLIPINPVPWYLIFCPHVRYCKKEDRKTIDLLVIIVCVYTEIQSRNAGIWFRWVQVFHFLYLKSSNKLTSFWGQLISHLDS